MILGIGIDICSISRMKNAIKNNHFVNRIFHKAEIEYAQKKVNAAASFAVVFAAREAFCKASSISMFEVAFSQGVWIERDEDGKPSIMLSEKSKEKLSSEGELSFHVSLSHEGDIAAAYVIIEKL
ncbi:MAG: holo-ACP synthase [Synergistaceae bacterium]|nr:holo-ACP synthase [Synergistaceae bacterium]